MNPDGRMGNSRSTRPRYEVPRFHENNRLSARSTASGSKEAYEALVAGSGGGHRGIIVAQPEDWHPDMRFSEAHGVGPTRDVVATALVAMLEDAARRPSEHQVARLRDLAAAELRNAEPGAWDLTEGEHTVARLEAQEWEDDPDQWLVTLTWWFSTPDGAACQGKAHGLHDELSHAVRLLLLELYEAFRLPPVPAEGEEPAVPIPDTSPPREMIVRVERVE